MTQRQHEPKQDEKLTGATNRQEFPARVVADDKAQADNVRRLQAAKEADYQRQTFESQREAANQESVTLKGPGGTRVTVAGDDLVRSLKAQGYKGA
jgi:hypothetical protein